MAFDPSSHYQGPGVAERYDEERFYSPERQIFDRNVSRPTRCGIGGVPTTGRQEGPQYERNFLGSHSARHCVPGKPRPNGVGGERLNGTK